MLQLTGPSVYALVSRPNGCALWRVLQPFQRLAERDYPAYWDFMGTEHNAEREAMGLPAISGRWHEAVWSALAGGGAAPADVLLVVRQGWQIAKDTDEATREAGLELMGRLRERGQTLIYECDDDIVSPWIIDQQRRGLLKEEDAEKLEDDRQARVAVLQACDGATVTSGRLATVLRQFVPDDFPIVVVPNFIDWALWVRSRHEHPRRVPRDTLTIGWIGGGRPDDDAAPMAWAWGQVAQTYPDVKFFVGGCLPDEKGQPSLEATPGVRPILDYLPRQKIIRQGWLDIRRYQALYRNIDIGCAPLADRPFNRCKSNIKVQEFAAAGAAAVASPTVYGSIIDHGHDGFLCADKYEWAEALKELVANAPRRREMKRALRRKVAEEWSLERNLWRWPAAWGAIVDAAAYRKRNKLVVAAR